MNILSVESSCDETAVAIVRDGREILTDCIASQVELHKLYGGVVPEIASRKHIEAIYGLADQALVTSGLTRKDLDAIAVTYAASVMGLLVLFFLTFIGSTLAVSAWNLLLYTVLWLIPELLITSMTAKR